jgi:hypothetical protein
MLRNSVSKLSLVFAFFLSVSPACGEADELGRGAGGSSGGTPASAAREGTVRGLVRDAQGRPLAGAEISISNAVYVTSPVSGASGADGAYLLELPPNQVWRAYGSITKTLGGRTYCSELAADKGEDFRSSVATIRNFTWQLSGLKSPSLPPHYGSSYYGARLSVNWTYRDGTGHYNFGQLRISFVPNGPLIDGSTIGPFSGVVGNWAGAELGNIPLGIYTVTADYLPPDGSAPIRLRVGTRFGSLAATTQVVFEPDQGSGCLVGPVGQLFVVDP